MKKIFLIFALTILFFNKGYAAVGEGAATEYIVTMQKLDRTFGVEIEFGLNNEASRDITESNFKSEFEMRTGEKIIMDTHSYNTPVNSNKWTMAYDMSVRVRSHYVRELKSPPIFSFRVSGRFISSGLGCSSICSIMASISSKVI